MPGYPPEIEMMMIAGYGLMFATAAVSAFVHKQFYPEHAKAMALIDIAEGMAFDDSGASINAKADTRIALRLAEEHFLGEGQLERAKSAADHVKFTDAQEKELLDCLALVDVFPEGEDLARFREFRAMSRSADLKTGLDRLLLRWPKRNVAYYNLTPDLIKVGDKEFPSLGVPVRLPIPRLGSTEQKGGVLIRPAEPRQYSFAGLLDELSVPPIHGDIVLVTPEVGETMPRMPGLRICAPVFDPADSETAVEFVEYA